MLRIVLPIVVSLAAIDVSIEIVVLIEIIVVVNVDVAAVPIAIAPVTAPGAPGSCPERNSRAPHQSCPRHIARIGVGIVRIFNRSGPVHHGRIVRGNVDYVRVRLLNFDYLPAAGDCLSLHYRLSIGL
jgi:hypothetical protein